MQNRKLSDYFIISLKGITMGAADVVPGVSGGTIAFISGIYDELLSSINAFNLDLFNIFKNEGFKKVWEKVNGNFLVALFSGILISIVSLAKMLSWLLENKPIFIWSFFFGLVLASIIFVIRQIKIWDIKSIISLIVGISLAYFITQISPTVNSNPSKIYLFFSGAIAICAMILPGISGSFVLVLLGVYAFVLDSVHQFKIGVILTVFLGAIVGLLSFSKFLKYLLDRYRDLTLAILVGFIIGSLNKIWPWKEILTTQTINNKLIVLKDKSVLPFDYQGENHFLAAVGFAFIGFILIVFIEKWANKNS